MTDVTADTHDHIELFRTLHGTARLVVEGHLDLAAVPHFRLAVADAAGEHTLLLDLAECTFVDAGGLGAVVGGIRRLQEHGTRVVLVVEPSSTVGQLLAATGVDRLVPVAA